MFFYKVTNGATTTSSKQDNPNSKSSNYSEMDVSSPFADVKQISVQNKPLGGKVSHILHGFISLTFYELYIQWWKINIDQHVDSQLI